VAREKFLCPGPLVHRGPSTSPTKPFHDARRRAALALSLHFLSAIDPARSLNNALPSFLGAQFLITSIWRVSSACWQVGAGTGYYSAHSAEMVVRKAA